MTETNNDTTESSANDWKEREMGALWKREGKNQRYLSGKITVGEFGVEKTINIVIFVNKFKEKDNQPDFRVYEDRPREEAAPTKEAVEKVEAPQPDADLPAMLQ